MYEVKSPHIAGISTFQEIKPWWQYLVLTLTCKRCWHWDHELCSIEVTSAQLSAISYCVDMPFQCI